MFQTSRYSLFILVALLAFTTYAGFVDCPTTPAFVNCLSCWQSASTSPIQCICPNTQFAIADRCFTPYYPCNSSSITLIYSPNSQFNIWNSTIQPFWEQKFNQAKTNATPPNPLPSILNNYNFSGMNLTLMRGWTEAYYIYLIVQKEISSWTVQKRSQVLYEAVQLAQNTLGNKTFEKWYKMGNMTNERLNKNMTYDQFFQFIRLRAKVLAPCHTCKPMYGPLKVGDQVRCSKCSPQCKSCSANTSVCNTCFDGNYLSGLFTCEDCNVGDCKNCTQNQCLTCFGFKTIDGGQCADCNGDIGCSLCQAQEPDICQQCDWLQFSINPNSQGKCFKCTQDSCQDCNPSNPSQCTSCTNSYYSDASSICQPCPQNCLVCENNKTCNDCFYGFGLIGGICKPCNIPGCLNCDSDLNACSSCITPYFDFNTTDWTCFLTKTTTRVGNFIYQTAKCKPGCDYCYDNNTDHCFSCHERYYLENRYCKKCMTGCLQCSTAVNCRLCVSGYALVGWNCVRCPDNCRKCSPSNTSQCLDCRHGYYNDNQVCKPSPKPQCFIFDYAENDKCLVCMPGYALTSEKKCIQCQVSCSYSCNPLNISECMRSRFQLLGQYVYMHVFQTQGCGLNVNGNCLAPEEGWQLTYDKNNKIVVKWDCLYPCATCNISTCYSCQPGYTFLNGNCNFDFSCNPTCPSCLAGTQRNYTTNACLACPVTNCGACFNGACLQCFEGYYLQGQTCLRCPEKCQRCYDANNCNTCASGYLWPLQIFEYAYDCVKCSENCKTCKFQPSLCTQCYPGMRLANFRCIKQYQAAFRYVLKFNYTEFLSGMKSQVLISEIINRTNVNYSEIFIISVKNGSTIVDGIISASNASAATTIYQSLKSYTLKSFVVQGSSFSFVNETVVVRCSSSGSADCPAGTEQSINGGVIAGIVIGVIALIILVVVLVICWRKRQRRSGKSSDIQIQSNSAASTNKVVQYQNVPPTSASDLQKKI